MSTLLIVGSPAKRSRTAALMSAVSKKLSDRGGRVKTLFVRDLDPQALLLTDSGHPDVVNASVSLAAADAVVVATPIYKAAYSGLLKVFLDLLPQNALKGKTVLPVATGGSPHHMLAIDYALRPVLTAMGAKTVLQGIYATDAQITLHKEGGYDISEEVDSRIEEALESFAQANSWMDVRSKSRNPEADFSPRCSA